MNSTTVHEEFASVQPDTAGLLPLSSGLHLSFLAASWNWYYVVLFLVALHSASVLWKFWWKAPSNVIIAAYPTPFGRWFTALRMIVDSDTVVQKAYDSSGGKPFAIPMMARWIVFVSDRDQLKKLECEPESILSMERALHELAFTEGILGNHQVPPEHTGPKSESFRVVLGVLKNKLRSNIPEMSSAIQKRIREAVALEMAPPTDKGNKDLSEWQKVRLMPALLRIFTRVNLLVFVGDDQASNTEAYEDFMGFFLSCTKAFPVLMLLPGFLQRIIGPVVMGWGITRHKAYKVLLGLTREALEDEKSDDGKPGHVAQWAVEITRLKDALAIAKITLGLLFASAFQVPVVAQFCIDRLCRNPEYQERLRDEALEYKDRSFGSSNQEMPYFDSFIKETARLGPGIILTAPRAVMVPYRSSDGYRIPTGNWLAIPQVSLMRDEKVWQNGSAFEGFRFVNEEDGTSKSRFTHPSYDFPFWGSIQHACPARFYVSVIMKMILSHLMVDYDFKLVDPTARPFLKFSYTRLPNPFMTILVRKRSQ